MSAAAVLWYAASGDPDATLVDAPGVPKVLLTALAGDDGTTARKVRVIVADDSAAIRLMVAAMLEPEPDFEVVREARTGLEAVVAAETDGAELLLLDLSMPELDGLEVIVRLRQSRPALRIAVLSGHTGPHVERRARELGAHDFIAKGTSPDEIVARLRAAAAVG